MCNPLISHSLHSAWTWLNTEFGILNVYFQSNNFKSGNSRMACSIKYTLYWKWWKCILQMKENKCVWWEWGIFDLITWNICNTRNVCDFSGNNLYCQFTFISHSIYYTKLSHKFTFWPVHPLHLILIYKLQMLFKNDPPPTPLLHSINNVCSFIEHKPSWQPTPVIISWYWMLFQVGQS